MDCFYLTDPAAWPQDGCVVALGFFDGVHTGHAALLERTVCEAAARGLAPAVFSFADGPAVKGGERRLTDGDARLALFARAGIARVYLADFPLLAPLSPEAFVDDVLIARLHAAAVVCGFNYRFGAGAAGDATLLATLLTTHGVPLFPIEEQRYCGKTVSTSAIKAALAAGDAETACGMLGRPYEIAGTVTHGKALGRTIGVPTANLPLSPRTVVPARGVYAVFCTVEGETLALPAVANIGVRPTVRDGGEENCEVHFLSEVGDLYGKRLSVRFLHFIRPEMTFSDLTALSARIALDKQIAKEYFDKWNGQS